MISASLYITMCTTRNRVRVRLRRLKEPRYLIGAVVGVAYLYFSIFAGRRGRSRRPGRGGDTRAPLELLSSWQAAGTSLATVVVLLAALVAWFLPARAGLLEFSKAETAMLFPAPVTRRQLLLHRVLRSQVGSLFAAVVMAIVLAPGGGFGRLRFGIAMWALLVTARIYYAAVALTRVRFASPSVSVRLMASLPACLLLAGLAVVAASVTRQLLLQPVASASDFAVRLARATASGLPSVALWPFAAVLRPQLATSAASYFPAMAGSLAVLGIVTAWMLANDGAFDLAAEEAAGARGDEAGTRASVASARDFGLKLGLSGRLELALLWKNAMQTLRATNVGFLRVVLPATGALIGLTAATMAVNRLAGPAGFVSAFSAAAAGIAVVFGPQMMRLDLRSDFEHLDLLKTWPVRPADLIRGEMAWPVAAMTATAWCGIVSAAVFAGTALPDIAAGDRWSFAVSAVLAAPALIAAQYTVHNAIALFFPAWVSLGSQRTRGIDAMGQRLIMLAAIFLALLLFALPGAAVAWVLWFAFRRFIGTAVLVPAFVLFAAIVLTEVLVVTELLGPAYERMDLMSVERAE